MKPAQVNARPGYGSGRAALLDAVTHLVARYGFRGLTYRALAKEARLTHGSVRYHFGSRDQLILAAAAKAARDGTDVSALQPSSHRLEDFAASLSQLAARFPDQHTFQFELAIESRRRPELRAEVKALYEKWYETTASALRDFNIPENPSLARLVFAALDGLTLQQLIFENPEETDEAVAELRSLLERRVQQDPN